MKGKLRYVAPVAAAFGFVGGHVANRPPAAAAVDEGTVAPGSRPDRPVAAVVFPAEEALTRAAGMRSADSREELLALDDNEELYARLALWLLDATEQEIAEFWAGYREREPRDTGVIDLLFAEWTRRDPHAAIEAAKGSGHEGIPWWAWALNDPDAAVAAVRGASKDMGGFVMRAIGQFHPERALRVLEENPAFARWNAIEGIVNGIARTDPRAAIEFQRANGQMYDTKPLEKWTRDDPQAVLEWLRAAPRDDHGRSQEAFLRTLERDNPELLADLAATAPSGQLKWKLESAAFRHLAAEDPAAALEQARGAESPRIAAERFAVVGRGMVADDPQGALAIFGELMTACPDATTRAFTSYSPGGSSSSGSGVEGVREFIAALVAWDPQAAMTAAGEDLAAPAAGMNGGNGSAVARAWAAQDLDGFIGWVETRESDGAYDRGAMTVIQQLQQQKEFVSAIEWSGQLTEPGQRQGYLRNTFQYWLNNDRQAALDWAARDDLPAETLEILQPYLPRE